MEQAEVMEKFPENLIEEKKNIIVDMSQVCHIDSCGLGALVKLLQKCKTYRGTLKMFALQTHSQIVFRITRLDKIFEIYDTFEECENSFKDKIDIV